MFNAMFDRAGALIADIVAPHRSSGYLGLFRAHSDRIDSPSAVSARAFARMMQARPESARIHPTSSRGFDPQIHSVRKTSTPRVQAAGGRIIGIRQSSGRAQAPRKSNTPKVLMAEDQAQVALMPSISRGVEGRHVGRDRASNSPSLAVAADLSSVGVSQFHCLGFATLEPDTAIDSRPRGQRRVIFLIFD